MRRPQYYKLVSFTNDFSEEYINDKIIPMITHDDDTLTSKKNIFLRRGHLQILLKPEAGTKIENA